jgi:hypothetical protein
MIHILLGIFHPTGLDGLDSDIKEIPARIRGINNFQIRIELIFGTQILVVPDSLDCNQWPFQEPKKLEVPTIYKAYIRPMQVNIPTKYGLIWYSPSISESV